MKKVKLKFTLNIPPKAKMRHRTTRTGHTYTPPKQVDWENECRLLLADYVPSDIKGPVRVDACFIVKRPKSMCERWKTTKNGHKAGEYKYPPGLIWHTVRPDLDNFKKSLLDALNAYLSDDSVVCFGRVMKCYSEIGKKSRIIVTITNRLWPPERRLASMGMRR
jgi:Holliday junction resolvase RusA-like endonuclease